MYMAVKEFNIRFIDSINFVNVPLSTFPKTFVLKELKKGYFPHLFNTPENQNYVGPEKRTAFLKWYDEQVDVFDFKKKLVAYCRSDVDILTRSMMTFRDDFLKIGNIDPLQHITIASVCMSIYRSKYMSENTIGIIKDVPKNTFSKTSIQCLKYISETENVYPTCNELRRTFYSDRGEGRRVLRTNKHRLRIPRLFLARVP